MYNLFNILVHLLLAKNETKKKTEPKKMTRFISEGSHDIGLL